MVGELIKISNIYVVLPIQIPDLYVVCANQTNY